MNIRKFINKKYFIFLLVAIVAFTMGKMFTKSSPEVPHTGHDHTSESLEKKDQIWTCSMHPQIKMPKPGKCPICGMALIPMNSGSEEDGERQLSMSEAAKKLAEIETSIVERRAVSKEVRMVGKVDYDESQVKEIPTRVGGRIDRLFVDYTGVSINKGDHLIYLYSPELYSAQEELIQSLNNLKEFSSNNSDYMKETANSNVEASRERLMQWGLKPVQIEEIEKTKKATDHMTIYSPISGVVIHKNAVEGNYVKPGTKIYTIADLSKVWVKFDAYESDINWLKIGQKISFTVEAYPGEEFSGRIGFIDPILNPKTRTIKVRVNVDNINLKLKPDMYVTGTIFVKLSPDGKVIDKYLAGKWISPMHPEIVRNKPGKCPICGMPLVKAESLGYTGESKFKGTPLIIPATAVLITGKRAVVYVELPNKSKLTFEGREVVLGPRVGGYYMVVSGLEEGERVVTKGNFKLDAELQIRAKPSMMSPDGGVAPAGHNHGSTTTNKKITKKSEKNEHSGIKTKQIVLPKNFQKAFTNVYKTYEKAQKSLVADNNKDAQISLEKMGTLAEKIDMSLISGEAHSYWMNWVKALSKSLEHVKHKDINGVRNVFSEVSNSLIDLIENTGVLNENKLFKLNCPMAMDGSGADWVQSDKSTQNPYMGQSMPECGSVTHTFKTK